MRYPLDTYELSDPYGMRIHPITGERRMHWGLDLAAPAGEPIRAIGDGIVTGASYSAGAGHWVMIRLDDGPTFDHFHMLRPAAVTPGQRVAEGDVLGYVGSTGASTGPHLHLEMWIGGARADPAPWLDRHTSRTPTPDHEERFMRIVRILDPQAEGACYLLTEAGCAYIDRPRTVAELTARGVRLDQMYWGDFADWVRLIHDAADDEHGITRARLAELGQRLGA